MSLREQHDNIASPAQVDPLRESSNINPNDARAYRSPTVTTMSPAMAVSTSSIAASKDEGQGCMAYKGNSRKCMRCAKGGSVFWEVPPVLLPFAKWII